MIWPVHDDIYRAFLTSTSPSSVTSRVGTDFSFGQEAWNAGVDVVYQGEQNDVSSFETDDYTLLGANFIYKLDFERTQWQLFVRGNNLLDKEARKSTSFIAAYAPLPGISFTAGVRGRF